MQSSGPASTTRTVAIVALAGGALAALAFVFAWRRDVRQLVRETEEYLAEQQLPSR